MRNHETRQQLVEFGASLFNRGYSVGTAGNLSVRVDEGLLMTPTNSSLGRLDVSELSELDGEFRHIGGGKPSKEVPMHQAMYEARPDARAIVHLHSTYVTALSCLWREGEPLIPPLTPYFVMRVGRDVPVVPYFKPGTTDAVAEIREAAARAPAVILAHHGSLVAGATLAAAVAAAEELEETARLALLLRDREPNVLGAGDIEALL
ncbi:aldolase [Gulosibacter massiliensis]|uniref:3-oxo-tetronate 4-phosphate decarboxylase n=1 Tax=Gulosibacter massiliensis TaxID=2479839 RepID=UPI000F63932B|nr:aldolase [Gulosibacter massiliensis]